MKKEIFEIGQTFGMFCAACETEQKHTVESATKTGQITKATCQACETSSTFSRGVKTSVALGKSKAASPYDRTRKYRKGQSMMHSTFGHGEVTEVIEPQKIDVLFGDTTRRLIHAQN